jgi:hippurate hydrolase
MALQMFVTRSVSVFAPGVVTVGKIEAGTTNNVIPETATLLGTVRTVAPATRTHILEGLSRVARGVAEAHGVSATTDITEGYPVTVNDADFARFTLEVGRQLVGSDRVWEQSSPQMAAEDFSYVLEQVPGAMISLGTAPPQFGEGEAPNAHSNRYVLDEEAMVTGMAIYAAVALEFLNQQ